MHVLHGLYVHADARSKLLGGVCTNLVRIRECDS